MTDILWPSSWSVTQARDTVADLKHVVSEDEYDVLELFGALCSHLDELYGGGYGFRSLLAPQARAEVAGLVRRIRGGTTLGSLDGVVRLGQPVNAVFTVAEGRQVAAALAAGDADSWQGELGRALQALYAYLDELYGGPGAFTELLNSEERAQVVRLIGSLSGS
ncbi:MAG TPA: hypothetical protein VGJ44_02125 [Kribbellaceae bacterium]